MEQASLRDEGVDAFISSFLGLEFKCLRPSEPVRFFTSGLPFELVWEAMTLLTALVLLELLLNGTGMIS